MNKKYIIEVATNPASLKKLKDDLQEATRLPKEGVEVPELSRETKAKVKKDLATLFGVADYQADALRSMVQAMTQGLTDDSSVQNMKTQLEQTLQFTTDIMENMQKMGKGTDWMKQGVGFVDDFIKMKESIETVEGLEKSVQHLTTTFEVFKDALAETNMDAFLQRFGNSTKAEAAILTKANKELQRIAKSRNEDLQKIINESHGEAEDFIGWTREDIEEEYKDAIQLIKEYNEEIEGLRHKYQGRDSALYKDSRYKSLIEMLSARVDYINNLPGLNTEDIGKNLKTSLQEATDSVKNAGKTIQDIVDGLKGTGIELAVTLPDVTTKEFAAEINKFIKKANEEFKDHPIEMTLDVTSPFKKDAFKKDGTLKELSSKQKELSQGIEKTFRENLQKENIEIGEDDLEGFYNVNTNVIARNIADAFNKLYKSMTAGQALIKGATKKWRDTIEEDLTIKPKFDTDGAKQAIANAITEIETDMEGGEYDLTIYPDTEQLVSEIQGVLKDPDNQFLIDVKVDNVDTSGVVLNVDSAQINSGGGIPFGFFPMQPSQQNTPQTPPAQSTPPTQETTTPKTTPKSTVDAPTKALTQNTNVVTEGTIAQRILTDAVNDLSQSLSTIDGRMKSVQDRISSVEQQREKNAKEIENNSKSIDSSKQRRETASVNKQSSQEKLERAKQDKANMENLISTINVELRNALKDGNIEGFNNRIKSIIDKDLPNVKKSLENQIDAIKKNAGMTDAVKETEIIKLTSFINDINRISDPNTDLTKDTDKNGTKLYFTAVRLAYRDKLKALDEAIADIEKEVASRQKDYSNADIAVTNAHQRERELSGEDKEESAEKQLKKFKDEKGALESRKKKIQKVLDNNEDPVTLVLNEVAEYWKTSDKKIADAEAYISKSEVQLKKLEKELEGYEDKKSPEYKKKQKEYDEENARLHKDKKYVTSKNAIENWTANNAVMRAAGLDLKEMKAGNEIQEIIRVLVENPTLADALGKNKNLKGLANIKNLEYFIPKVQQTLGADSRAYEDYMSEQELRANFLEALKINEYIIAARQMLKAGDTDISPADIQNFIAYFADIPDMAQAVSVARQYLEEVNKLPKSTWENDVQESYFDQFKNAWGSLDKDSRRVFLDAYSDSKQAHGIKFTDIQNIDSDRFSKILAAFNEDESSLKGLETDNKQLQQILGILQRSSLLTATKDISSQYGEHGILASLFGMQKSNLMGNKYAPKAPIYITTHDEKDREKIYELGAKGGRSQSSDGKFNFTPESFDRMIKKTNTADEMSDILSLIFDPLVLQNEKLEHKIRNLRTDLNALKTLDFSDDESTVDSKKKMRRLSYNALDGTDVERRWHRYKILQGEIGSVKGALQSGLDNGVIPDVLWKNIKGLRKQRGLEKELRGLDNGEFSDDVKRQLKGLTDKEKEKKVKEIKAEKKSEFEELKKQNVKDVTKFLTDKVKEYLDLENKIIKQTDTTIAAKEKELEAAEKQHEKNAPVVAQRKQEADEILQQMMESGKFKLSHGKGSVTPKWDQKYEYQDTELAKFEKRKEANDRTIEILKKQNEDDRQLLELLKSNQTNDKIDEMLNGLSEKDKEKPKEAQLDLLKNKITVAMNHRDAEIERLNNIAISLKDVIESIVVLEEDIERGKAKEKHESQLASADKRRSKRVLKPNKRQFDSKKTAYQLALKREASQFNFNNQFATSKTASTQESQPEFTNLLSKIKLASDWNIFDTTKINEMVDEYLRLIEEAKTLAKSGTASNDDLSKIEGSIREAQDKLVKEWFSTDNWHVVDLLESRFSVIDGELRQAEQAIMSEASSAKATHDATESVLAEQKQKAHKLLEEYVSQLKEQYIDKPKEEVLSALNKEVNGINADAASVEAELQAVDGRADKALEEQRRNLVTEYQNDPLYKQLLEQRSKILNSEDYNIKDVNSEKYKAAHKQANDITDRLHEIEIAYDQKFKELRDKWIADEREKILKSATKDSYSKNAYKLKDAYDKKDRNLSTVHQRAQQDSGIVAIKEQVTKELQADEKYINLLQQYKQMSKAEQNSESGKKIYSQIQSIKQKYDQKIADAINAWKNAEVEKINKTFDDTVSTIINCVLRNKRSGIRNDQLSTLEEQKKAVIERLSRTNSEFSNLVNSVSANLKEQLGDNPDVFQLSKELVNRGLPTDISFEDAFILSTDKIETSEQYKKYFARIQKVLLEQVGKMLQAMVDSADNPKLVSEEEIKAQIEAKRVEATKKKREKVDEVKGKSARELLSDRYDDTGDEHYGKAAGIKKDRENLETKRDDIKKKYGVTDEMIKASRKGTLIVKVNAKRVETTPSAQESHKQTQTTQVSQQTKQTTPITQQQAQLQFKQQQSGGLTYAPYGYVQTLVDTSDLAKEGTLRGIYEVLNGGAPDGGWDDSISESTKTHENQGGNDNAFASGVKEALDLSVHSFSGTLSNLARSIGQFTSDVRGLPYENMAFFDGEKTVGEYIEGGRNSVDTKSITSFLEKYRNNDPQLALHNHPDGISALTPADIKSALNLAIEYGVGASGVVTDDKITGVDFSGISNEMGTQIWQTYKKSIKQSKFKDLFRFDASLLSHLTPGIDFDTQELSDELNKLLRDAIASVGLNPDDIFGQMDVSKLDETKTSKYAELAAERAKVMREYAAIVDQFGLGTHSDMNRPIDPNHLQEAYEQSKKNRDGVRFAPSTDPNRDALRALKTDVGKALLQIARFPENYGGEKILPKDSKKYFNDNRIHADAIIPFGDSKRVLFGYSGSKSYGHYGKLNQTKLTVIDDNTGETYYGNGNYQFYDNIADNPETHLKMSQDELAQLPIIQKARADYDEQSKEDDQIAYLLRNLDGKTPEYIAAVRPLFDRLLVLEQQLTAEKQALEKEIGADTKTPQTSKESTKPVQQPVAQVAESVIESGAQAAIDSVDATPTPTVPTKQAEQATTQVADAMTENASEAIQKVANNIPIEPVTAPQQEMPKKSQLASWEYNPIAPSQAYFSPKKSVDPDSKQLHFTINDDSSLDLDLEKLTGLKNLSGHMKNSGLGELYDFFVDGQKITDGNIGTVGGYYSLADAEIISKPTVRQLNGGNYLPDKKGEIHVVDVNKAEERKKNKAPSSVVTPSQVVSPDANNVDAKSAAQDYAEAIAETGVKAVKDDVNTIPTPDVPTQPVQEAVAQVSNNIVDAATEEVVRYKETVPQTNIDENLPAQEVNDAIDDNPSDILSIYKATFDKFDFKDTLGSRVSELIGKCRDYIEVQFEEGDLSDDIIGDLFKEAENGELTVASKDLYKAQDIRGKIISILLDSIDENFAMNGLSDLYESNKANIKQALDSVVPNGNIFDENTKKQPSQNKNTPKKGEPIEETLTQTDVVSAEKISESTQKIEDSNRVITSEQEQQSALSTEIAQNTDKTANNAEQKATKNKKKSKGKDEPKTSSDVGVTPPSTPSSTTKIPDDGKPQGGILGLLGKIAQEATLQSVLAQLSNGVKTSSSGESGRTSRRNTKKTTDDISNISSSEAYDKMVSYATDKYSHISSNPDKVTSKANGYSMDILRPKNLEEIKVLQDKINQLTVDGKINTQEYADAQTKLNALMKEQEKITLSISSDGKTITEKSGFQNLAIGAKAAMKELQNVDTVMSHLQESGTLSFDSNGDITSSNQKIQNYIDSLKNLQTYKDSLSSKELFDPSTQQRLSDLTLETQNYRKEVISLLNATAQYNTGEKIDFTFDGVSDDYGKIKQAMQDAVAQNSEFQASFGNLTPIIKNGQVVSYQLAYTLQTGKHEVQEMTASLNPLTGELRVQQGAVKEVATGWEQFFSGLKGKMSSIVQYLVSITSIQDMFRYMREGVQYVREIDGALTELKKVTNETDASYAKFLQDMAKTGGTIGATVSNLTTMAAEWAKLGYSMEEAGRLAESTAILLNVSEFEDATTASEALISTMQAFGYAAEDSQHVVDVLNEVGNNYAISSDGIATALQDSASALMEAGNTLEQSVALVASANKVVQDPNSVGSALRTISLRLRGTSVEVLESLGEETDGAIESVSKMQKKIEALTGVNILTDAGAYKDTYTILQEIGTVWEDMSDIDQAALLELMAGKNRANTLAAILGNMEDLEGAYNDALNAEGSALKENAAYLDSIQGRIDLFNNAVQTMWMNFIDTDVVKFIVDIGTGLIKLVDTLGMIPTLLGAFSGFKLIKSVIGGDAFKLFASEVIDVVKAKGLLTAASQKESAALIAEAASVALADSSLVKYAITSGLVTAEQVASMTTTQLLGTAFLGLAAKVKAATIAMAKFLVTTPVGWAILAVAAITALGVAYTATVKTHEDYIEELETETEELKSIQNELKNVKSELDTTKDRIDELQAKGTLSFVEEEELDRLKQQTEELERQNEILLAREKSTRKKQIEAALGAIKADKQNTDDVTVATGFKYAAFSTDTSIPAVPYAASLQSDSSTTVTKYEKTINSLKEAKKDLEDAEKELTKFPNAESKEYKNAEKAVTEAQERVERFNNDIQTMNDTWTTEYGEVGYIENATEEWEKEWNEYYRQHQDYIDQWMLLNNEYKDGKATVLDRVFGKTATDSSKDLKASFESSVKEGKDPTKVIEELLASGNYDSVLDDLKNKFNITADDIVGYFTNVGEVIKAQSEINPVQSYSTLTTSLESYNEILAQTSEIVFDNVEVTQEYKDSLASLGISSEELAKCFDENNPLIVKNAEQLNNLVKSSKNNIAQNTKLAKSQAKLKYYELYKKMRSLTNGRKVENSATLAQVKSIYQEMSALQKVIAKYSMLEHQLLGATNAYDKLADAQAADEAADYGSKAEELVNVLANAFNTSELGTEAAQVAISGLIPDDIIDKSKTLDEQMQQIYSYFTKGAMSKLFTIEFDDDGKITSVEMMKEDVEAFTKSLIGSVEDGAVFQGTWDEFTLNPAITSLEEFAKACGLTEEVAFAFLTSLEKYDISWLGGDNSTLLDQLMGDNLEYKIDNTVQKLTELEYGLATGQISAEEYQKQMYGLNGELRAGLITQDEYKARLSELKKQYDAGEISLREYNTALSGLDYAYNALGKYDVRPEVNAWIETTDQLQKAKAKLQEYYNILNSAKRDSDGKYKDKEGNIIDVNSVQADIDKTTGEINKLMGKLADLEEPTQLTLQFASDSIQKELDDIEKKIGDLVEDTHYSFDIEAGKYTVMLDESDPNYQKVVEFVDLLNEQHVINTKMGEDTPTVTDQLQSIADILQKISDLLDERYHINVDTSSALDNTRTFKNLWDSIQSKSITLTQNIKEVVSRFFSKDGGSDSVNGTAHANGTAYKSGSWGAQTTETALVGELGPELLVRGSRWTTIGDNGAEFTQVKKGDIIFNHKQTEDLLSKGFVTGRGKLQGGHAFASGTTYAGINTWDDSYNQLHNDYSNATYDDDDSNDDDDQDDTEEVVDFIEMKLEEIETIIEKTTNKISNFLDDTTSIKSKGELYDELIKAEKDKSEAYLEAARKYNVEAAAALSGVPQEYQEMARNGAIAIETFIGEDQAEIAEAIQEYRDWASKADEAENGHLEAIASISAHRVEQLEDIATDFENILSITKSHSDLLQAEMDFIEESGGRLSENYYEELKQHSQKQLDDMQAERVALQKILDDSVAAGDVVIGSDDWYSMLSTIYEVDQEIIDCKTSLEEFQNAINDLYWNNFDKLIAEIDNVNSELSSLYDFISDDDKIVDDMGNWTADGYTALGLLVQQMEVAQQKSKEYGDAISKLKKDYKDGLYSTDEYNEKLADLTNSQYDAIKSYEDAKDAIIDLNKTRVDAVKDGMQKEIDAYSELIEKKKEALSEDKAAYDFQKQVQESNKNIKDIERKIASLEGNTSSSAMAQRKRLEAELLKAREELQDLYYDHSIEKQQEALDKELEGYTESKEDQMDSLDEYLKKEEQVIADSFDLVAENTKAIADTLIQISEEYGVSISDTVVTPWINGANAIGTYEEQLDTTVSTTTANLEALKQQLEDLQVQADKTAKSIVNATHSTIVETNDGHQTSIKGYAKGTASVPKSGLYNLDELGPELVLHAGKNGKLEYLTMDSAVIPADLTQKLMQWGQLDPSQVLERSASQIGMPNIATTNNNMEINLQIAEVVHIDHADNSSIPDITKAVKTQMDNYMRDLNNKLRRK